MIGVRLKGKSKRRSRRLRQLNLLFMDTGSKFMAASDRQCYISSRQASEG